MDKEKESHQWIKLKSWYYTIIKNTRCFLIVLLLLGIVSWGISQEANIYIAQSAAIDSSGVDASHAHSVSWFNNSQSWGVEDGKIGPGTVVHLCGIISTSLNIRGSGSESRPITILFEKDAKLSAEVWEYVTWARTALRTSSVDHIIIDGGENGVIESTSNGTTRTYKESQSGVWLYGSHYCEVKNLIIRDMYVRTPVSDDDGSGMGIYTSGSHLKIHHNTISEAETGISLTFPGSNLTQDLKVHNNRIFRISNGITCGSGNSNAVGNDFEIFDNDISDGFVWDGIRASDSAWYHSDGIQVWAVHSGSNLTNLKIHGNYIHGDMGRHITGWIFVEGNVTWPFIFNNVLMNTGTSYPSNGMITSSGYIFNNTIVMFNPGIGINSGPNSHIKNNLLYNCGTGIGIHYPDTNTQIDYNLFYSPEPIENAKVGTGGTFYFYSYENWKSLGFDQNSKNSNPGFMNIQNLNFHLTFESIAKNAGTELSENTAFDKDRNIRPQGTGWDIGAYEFIEPTAVDGNWENPIEYCLHQNFPNPFNPYTTITFSILLAGNLSVTSVQLKVYDVLGREVAMLANGLYSAGEYTVEWKGTNSAGQNVGSGIYFYQLKTGNGFIKTKKMVLLK